MPGRIIVKKLPDDTVTNSGIIIPTYAPINKRHEYVEVISVGQQLSNEMNIKIEVKPRDRCLILGRGIYDTIELDDDTYYILTQADVYAIIER